MNEATSHSLRKFLLPATAVLSLGVVAWLWRPDHESNKSTRPAGGSDLAEEPGWVRTSDEPQLLAARHSESESGQRLMAAHRPEFEPQQELAGDGVPIMGATGDSTEYGPRHPHPITPEHQRIQRENALIGSLNGAMDVGDFEGLRELNERYKIEHPDDAHALQAGYDLIADCLEERTPDNRSRAERYFAEERASTLRRYVQRHCLK